MHDLFLSLSSLLLILLPLLLWLLLLLLPSSHEAFQADLGVCDHHGHPPTVHPTN